MKQWILEIYLNGGELQHGPQLFSYLYGCKGGYDLIGADKCIRILFSNPYLVPVNNSNNTYSGHPTGWKILNYNSETHIHLNISDFDHHTFLAYFFDVNAEKHNDFSQILENIRKGEGYVSDWIKTAANKLSQEDEQQKAIEEEKRNNPQVAEVKPKAKASANKQKTLSSKNTPQKPTTKKKSTKKETDNTDQSFLFPL